MAHVHRYERTVLGKKGFTVYRCNFPDCTHYIRAELARDKKCICNRCGGEMILDSRAMKFVKPYCVDCIRSKKEVTPEQAAIRKFLEANDIG